MGLDSSLYSIGEEGWRRLEAQREFRRRIDEMCRARFGPIIDNLPKTEDGRTYVEVLDKGQRNEFFTSAREYKELRREVASRIGVALDEDLDCAETGMGYEIYDFGRDWELYRFIVQNFWHEDGKANCVEIRLMEADLERLVEFFGGDTGESPEADAFAEALEEARNGRIVYYYPWY